MIYSLLATHPNTQTPDLGYCQHPLKQRDHCSITTEDISDLHHTHLISLGKHDGLGLK